MSVKLVPEEGFEPPTNPDATRRGCSAFGTRPTLVEGFCSAGSSSPVWALLPGTISPELLSTAKGYLLLSSRYALYCVFPGAWPSQFLNRTISLHDALPIYKPRQA